MKGSRIQIQGFAWSFPVALGAESRRGPRAVGFRVVGLRAKALSRTKDIQRYTQIYRDTYYIYIYIERLLHTF